MRRERRREMVARYPQRSAVGRINRRPAFVIFLTNDGGRFGEAKSVYKDAIKRFPIAARRGNIEAAVQIIDEAERIAASTGVGPIHRLNFLRGDLLARTDRPAEAEAAFKKEIEFFPNHLQAYISLAIVYFAQGKQSDMRAIVKRMTESNPVHAASRSPRKHSRLSISKNWPHSIEIALGERAEKIASTTCAIELLERGRPVRGRQIRRATDHDCSLYWNHRGGENRNECGSSLRNELLNQSGSAL